MVFYKHNTVVITALEGHLSPLRLGPFLPFASLNQKGQGSSAQRVNASPPAGPDLVKAHFVWTRCQAAGGALLLKNEM